MKNRIFIFLAVVAFAFSAFGVSNAYVVMPTLVLNAVDNDIPYNHSAELYWNTSNATSCVGTGGTSGWAGSKEVWSSSFYIDHLTQTTTFTMTCSNSYGTVTDSETIVVGPEPITYPTVTLTSNKNNIPYGDSVNLTWHSYNALNCNAFDGTNNWAGAKNLNGTFNTGALLGTTTYSITCTNSNNGSDTKSVTINVGNQVIPNNTQPPTLNIYAMPVNINDGNSSTVYWSTTNATSCYANGGTNNWPGVRSTSGNFFTGALYNTTTFSMTCTGSGGSVTNSAVVLVNNQPGTNNPPTLNIYASPTNVAYGNSSTVYWNTSNATSCFANSGASNWSGSKSTSGNFFTGSLYNTTTFSMTCTGIGGSVTNTATVVVGQQNIIIDPCANFNSCTSTAVTTIASNIGRNSARLNGLGLVNNNVSTNGYFEWGTSQALGSATAPGFIGSSLSSPFYANISGLAPNTTYYFRAVITNQYGVSRGDILSFRTLAAPTITTTTNTNVVYRDRVVVTNVVDKNTINTSNVLGATVSKPSLVFLTISGNNEIINIGNTLNYVVTYKNISAQNLKDVVLTVLFPKELGFIDTNRGYFSEENNTVVVNIGDLFHGQEGSVLIRVEVLKTAEAGKILVVTANLAYTIVADNTQEEVFAYSKNMVGNGTTNVGNALTGITIFGGDFFPKTLVGWLFIILIFVLAFLFLSLMFSGKKSEPMVPYSEKK